MKSSMIKQELNFLVDCSIEAIIEMKFSIAMYAGVVLSSLFLR